LDAPSTEVASTPSFTIIGSNAVPVRIDWPTMTCFQATMLPLRVEAGFQRVEVHRPVEAGLHVVLASPHQLDRRFAADGFGDRRGLEQEVRFRIGAAAEAAAGEELVERHLLGLEAELLRDLDAVDGLELLAVPDLA
jgi:hypothetical protein